LSEELTLSGIEKKSIKSLRTGSIYLLNDRFHQKMDSRRQRLVSISGDSGAEIRTRPIGSPFLIKHDDMGNVIHEPKQIAAE